MANRLANESSPYLRQHASNPVDWQPWGPEALERARREDKPIFLSIGYSACHWCHVMEHESFMDPSVAAVLNQHFVNIKVDREERPDLDQIYMNAVTAMTGHGGWPMSVFLTPTLEPFYAGTYFPPDDRYPNMPSFRRLLDALIQGWAQRPADLKEQAREVAVHLRNAAAASVEPSGITPELLRNAANALRNQFDPRHGGFGRAPKFPHSMDLRQLMRVWKRFGDADVLAMAQTSLQKMAMGGIYDHLGGGFHRYSTDAQWLAPHFEKMLYDNALLVPAYLDAYQITRNPDYARIVNETLAWVAREMTSPDGGFYSTQDADSEGEEGKFYVWSAREVGQLLGAELFETFAAVYDVSDSGNWEHKNILHRPKTDTQDTKLLRIGQEELAAQLAAGRKKLFEARERRVRPARDEKILTAWNGLMIDALAQAGQVIDPRYAQQAARAADFVLQNLRRPDGRLFRTVSAGATAKLNAYLEDYAFLANGLVTLYEATWSARWIKAAIELVDVMIAQFADDREGGFFFTGKDHEELILRGKDPQDNAVPSGNSMAIMALLRLAKLTGRQDYADRAGRTLEHFSGLMARHPMAFGQMLCGVDFRLGPVDEIAVRGSYELVRPVLFAGYRPNQVVCGSDAPDDATEFVEQTKLVPLLAGKPLAKEVTTFICRDFVCSNPINGVQALHNELRTE